MPIVTNEQSEKRPGLFLKIEDKSRIVLHSNLYKVLTHWIERDKKTIGCPGSDKCVMCKGGVTNRTEFNYWGSVSGETGVVRVPAGIFFAMNEAERLLGIEKRDVEWVISKKGEGKATKYNTVNGRAVTEKMDVTEANDKLTKGMTTYEAGLMRKYQEHTGDDEVGAKMVETADDTPMPTPPWEQGEDEVVE